MLQNGRQRRRLARPLAAAGRSPRPRLSRSQPHVSQTSPSGTPCVQTALHSGLRAETARWVGFVSRRAEGAAPQSACLRYLGREEPTSHAGGPRSAACRAPVASQPPMKELPNGRSAAASTLPLGSRTRHTPRCGWLAQTLQPRCHTPRPRLARAVDAALRSPSLVDCPRPACIPNGPDALAISPVVAQASVPTMVSLRSRDGSGLDTLVQLLVRQGQPLLEANAARVAQRARAVGPTAPLQGSGRGATGPVSLLQHAHPTTSKAATTTAELPSALRNSSWAPVRLGLPRPHTPVASPWRRSCGRSRPS
jgi:hypothetical protein